MMMRRGRRGRGGRKVRGGWRARKESRGRSWERKDKERYKRRDEEIEITP